MKYLFCLASILSTLFLTAQQPAVIQTNSAPDLIPEGIAVDERTGQIYVSSINHHSILTFGKDGQTKEFVKPNQDGFLEGLGLKIDKAQNRLWALSNKRDSNQFTSRIHAFDLTTGKTLFLYTQTDTIPHLFNDLVIAPDGTLYFTDTYFSAVYQLSPDAKAPAVLVKSSSLDYPNGLVFGKGSRLLIATYRNGLMQLDPSSKALKPLTGAKDSALSYGLDGLIYWNNFLIGVNNIGENRATNTVVQYRLNPEGDSIIGKKIIDKGHAVFHEPTTAALVNNQLYVLANSHLASYNANKESTAGIVDKLTPIAVVVYNLQ
jgi:DNA-binding beta-propeller fold protein YncE